jgi:hypothetical protein
MNAAELAKKFGERPDATVGIRAFHDHLGAAIPQPEHSTGMYAHLSRWLLDHLGAPTHEDDSPALISPIGYVAVLGQLAAEVGMGIDARGVSVDRTQGVYDPSFSMEEKCEYLIRVGGVAAGADFEAQVREEAVMFGLIQAPDAPAAA